MNKKQYIIILLAALLYGCGGSKPAAAPLTAQQQAAENEASLKLDAMMIEAKMQSEVGNREVAERQLRALLKTDPHYGAAHYEMSALMMMQGRLDSAIVYAERAIACREDNVWYHLRLAQCLELTGRSARLAEEWDRILRLKPHPVVAESIRQQQKRHYAIQAEQHMRAGQYRKAKQCYDRALEADPEDEYLHLSLATYYKTTGNESKAAAELRLGLQGNALSTKEKMQMLTGFYPQEEFYGKCAQYALPLAEMVMSQSDRPEETAAMYGSILMSQGKLAEAQAQLELALTADSGDYKVWEALLVCLMEQKPTDWPRVAQYAERARALFPMLPMPYYALGKSAEAAGDTEKAKALLEKAEELKL